METKIEQAAFLLARLCQPAGLGRVNWLRNIGDIRALAGQGGPLAQGRVQVCQDESHWLLMAGCKPSVERALENGDGAPAARTRVNHGVGSNIRQIAQQNIAGLQRG